MPQSEAETEHEQDVAKDIEEVVELPAAFAFHEFRARDLAIAAVEDAENLEEDETPEERPVGSMAENKRRDNWNRKDQPGPCVRRSGKTQQQPGDGAGNGTIQIAGNETVLRLAAGPEKFLFDPVDLLAGGDVLPRSFG